MPCYSCMRGLHHFHILPHQIALEGPEETISLYDQPVTILNPNRAKGFFGNASGSVSGSEKSETTVLESESESESCSERESESYSESELEQSSERGSKFDLNQVSILD